MKRIIVCGILFAIGLIYILLPAPSSIQEIPGVPGSLKSDEPGDTWQNPNIAGYYTNARRAEVTSFYRDSFWQLHCCLDFNNFLNRIFFLIPPIRINRPPEEAYTYIRDQQRSTYLEEYLYPLRESLFVNGYEPFDENGVAFNNKSFTMLIDGKVYDSKVTIRYYPSAWGSRLLVYLGIWAGLIGLFIVLRRIFKKKL